MKKTTTATRAAMNLSRLRAATMLVCGGVGLAPAAAADLLTVEPVNNQSLMAGGVSSNGSVIVGTIGPNVNAFGAQGRGFMWTQAGGINVFATPGPYSQFTAMGVSNSGNYIAGSATADLITPGGSTSQVRAYRWSAAGGFEDLGSVYGNEGGVAKAISGDGSVVVGARAEWAAFRWKSGVGMSALDGGFAAQHPMATNYDGTVVVGTRTYPDIRAVRWKDGVGAELLPLLQEGSSSWAHDVSDDGSVIVGWTDAKAVRWTDTGVFALGHLGASPFNASVAYGVSGNGQVIVGMAGTGQGVNDPMRAFRWTDAGGMKTVEDWLRDSGAVIAADSTYLARATNCDGSVVVGETSMVHPMLVGGPKSSLFIARGQGTGANNCLTADAGGSSGGGNNGGGNTGGGNNGGNNNGGGNTGGGNTGGGVGLIVMDQFNTTLAATGAANVASLGSINLLLNGAGSRPLDRRAAPGRSVFWAGGDLGRTDVRGDHGRAGVGEVGVGKNFGDVQVNAVAGFSRLDQDLPLGGRSDLSSTYVKLEALSRLGGTEQAGLWGAVTAAATWGHADMRRSYLNGGVVDSSRGQTDTSGYGIRARLQWENLVQHVSPYADIAYSRGCFDAYTETGGGFPAAFDKLCDKSTEMRYGFDWSYPVSSQFTLLGTLEGVHRFQRKGANVTGRAIGLYAFDLGGATYRQDWLRAGVGLATRIGGSTLSVMGNATTQSGGTNAWLAVNWRVDF